MLNGALFVLIGLQAQAAVGGQNGAAFTRGLISVAVVSAVVICVGFAWRGMIPNFVAVNYYDLGDLFETVNRLNGVG